MGSVESERSNFNFKFVSLSNDVHVLVLSIECDDEYTNIDSIIFDSLKVQELRNLIFSVPNKVREKDKQHEISEEFR